MQYWILLCYFCFVYRSDKCIYVTHYNCNELTNEGLRFRARTYIKYKLVNVNYCLWFDQCLPSCNANVLHFTWLYFDTVFKMFNESELITHFDRIYDFAKVLALKSVREIQIPICSSLTQLTSTDCLKLLVSILIK